MSARPHPRIVLNKHNDIPNTLLNKKGNWKVNYHPLQRTDLPTEIIGRLFLEVECKNETNNQSEYFDICIKADGFPNISLPFKCYRVRKVYGVITSILDNDGRGGQYVSFSTTLEFILWSSIGASEGTDDASEINPEVSIGSFYYICLLYTSPSPRDRQKSRMPSSA